MQPFNVYIQMCRLRNEASKMYVLETAEGKFKYEKNTTSVKLRGPQVVGLYV